MTVTQDRSEVLYFAFGSNLSTEQMRSRCPFSTPVGLGYMEGWKWIINERGYANVVRDPGAPATQGGVYGLLYLLPSRDEEELDLHEGVPWAYEKRCCDVRMVRDNRGRQVDEPVRALVYVDEKRVGEGVPEEEYVGRMERGIEDAVRHWGMDGGYAERVMRRFWKR